MSMAELNFPFDPSLFPEPPAVPPSAELFSAAETSDFFGFLDNFNDWDVEPDVFANQAQQTVQLPSFDSYLNAYAEGSPSSDDRPRTGSSSSTGAEGSVRSHPYSRHDPAQTALGTRKSPKKASSPSGSGPTRTKSLLSDPQKRMNHIMSEQKRRNLIREGYAQLTALMAPAGAPPGTGMPTRGRPKGSGTKGKSIPGAGKSGVLLRAVEYCRWLEEGRDALLTEVARVEAAAGLRFPSGEYAKREEISY